MSVKVSVRMEMPGKEPKEYNYDFDQDVITLGRDSGNDIQIPLTTVSRNHAKVVREGGEYFLEDLKSTHGTTHNGKPVGSGGKKLLRSGDTIELMHFKITFTTETNKPLEVGQSEKTEMLAQRMVREVLSSIGGTQELPRLRVMNGPDEGKVHELVEGVGEVVIGRATDCDFPINDANISRRHAIVRKDWKGITVEDLGSKNGVCINERKIEKAALLKDRDEISLGAVKILFIDPTASMIDKLDDIEIFKQQEPPPEEEPAPEQSAEQSAAADASAEGSSGDGSSEAQADGNGEAPAEGGGEEGEGAAAEGGDGAAEAAAKEEEDVPKVKSSGDYLVYAAILLVLLGVVGLGVVAFTML